MIKYKIKAEYKGVKMTINNKVIGRVTFDESVDPSEYVQYIKMGFGVIFEVDNDVEVDNDDKELVKQLLVEEILVGVKNKRSIKK